MWTTHQMLESNEAHDKHAEPVPVHVTSPKPKHANIRLNDGSRLYCLYDIDGILYFCLTMISTRPLSFENLFQVHFKCIFFLTLSFLSILSSLQPSSNVVLEYMQISTGTSMITLFKRLIHERLAFKTLSFINVHIIQNAMKKNLKQYSAYYVINHLKTQKHIVVAHVIHYVFQRKTQHWSPNIIDIRSCREALPATVPVSEYLVTYNVITALIFSFVLLFCQRPKSKYLRLMIWQTSWVTRSISSMRMPNYSVPIIDIGGHCLPLLFW